MRKLLIAASCLLLLAGCSKKKKDDEPAETPKPSASAAPVVVVTPPAESTPSATASSSPTPFAYSTMTPEPTAAPTPTPTPTASADPVYTAGTYGWVEVKVDGLNVRDKAGTDGNVKGQTQNGSKLYVYAKPVQNGGYTWSKIDKDSEQWIADKDGTWLKYTSYPEAVSADTITGDPVKTDGTVGWVLVKVDQLNIRDKSGTDGKVVGQAKNGGKYYVYGEPVSAGGYTWYKISGTDNAWIADSGEWLTYTKFE